MRSLRLIVFGLLSVFVLAGFAVAQETEVKVVDEVVAQVNEGVITLSRIRREKQNAIETYKLEGKPADEAAKLVEEHEAEMIAGLINEALLTQKAKDLGLEPEIDAAINARMVDIMKSNNVKTIEALYQMMQSQGVDPQDLKYAWRKQIIRERVIQREVQQKVYWEATGKQLRDYFEKNKAKFIKPEMVSISEIFIGFAGRDENAVRAKAKQVYDELTKGGDFAKITKENSDAGLVTQGKGKEENLKMSELVSEIATPLKGIKTGEYTLPFEIKDMGMVILRVDAHDLGGGESTFDEDAVRLAVLSEKAPEATRKFLATLRADAYIKISEIYRPLVNPILFAEERKEKPTK